MNEHPEQKIRALVILFHRMNTGMLLGQIEGIVKNQRQLKILVHEETERMRLGVLILECIGDLPEVLMYELSFNPLLMDYMIYEVPTHDEDGQERERMWNLKERCHAERA